jgi:tetratricopeptide (TPR) repeat protein
MQRGNSNLQKEKRLGLELELADMYSEIQDWSQAEIKYRALVEEPDLRFSAQFGLALSLSSQEKHEDMIALLEEIEPSSSEEIQGIQQLLENIPETHQSEQTQALWKSLAQKSDDSDLQFTALLQEADQFLQDDKFEKALETYDEAEQMALEEQQRGWAKLGKARTLGTLEKDPSAILLGLQEHPNPEIAVQANIQLAQFYLEQDRATEALEVLKGKSAAELGPGWDSSMEEIRVYALGTLEMYSEAQTMIQSLKERWPEEEQVQIPAKILSINLLTQQEQYSEAKSLLQETLKETSEEGYTEMLATIETELAKY